MPLNELQCYSEKPRKKKNELLCELYFLLSAQNAQMENNASKIKQVKAELELMDPENYKGAIMRARAENLWLGERQENVPCATKKDTGLKMRLKRLSTMVALRIIAYTVSA